MKNHNDNNEQEESAETIALQVLTFLLSEPKQSDRFLTDTGFAPDYIRANAGAHNVLEAALSILIQDEAALLAFAANAGLRPDSVLDAHSRLLAAGRNEPLAPT